MAFEIEQHDVTGATGCYIVLGYPPTRPIDVAVDPVGGPAQVYGMDFVAYGVPGLTGVLSWGGQTSDPSGLTGTSSIRQVVLDQFTGYSGITGYTTTLRVMYER
jgi:hypothetical protein